MEFTIDFAAMIAHETQRNIDFFQCSFDVSNIVRRNSHIQRFSAIFSFGIWQHRSINELFRKFRENRETESLGSGAVKS